MLGYMADLPILPVYSRATFSSPARKAPWCHSLMVRGACSIGWSPELWFEDFGTAKLKSGRALVKLDADFAKVIKRGDYRVFMTPEGDCRGLYVHRKRANTFEVRELGGGKSNIAFSYRIVGRRKDIKGRRRFAKVDMGLPLLPAAPRKSAPTAARLRALIADVANELGQRGRTKGAEKRRGSRVLPRGSRPSIRPQLPLARARKK